MTRRPSFTELVDWLEDRLPEDRASDVAAAVEDAERIGDHELLDAAAWIRAFHRDSGSLQHTPVPDELQDRLRALFRDRQRPWESAGYLPPHAVVDSRDLPRAVGFRGGSPAALAEARRIVIERDAIRLVLEVAEQTEDGLTVHGTITVADPAADPAASQGRPGPLAASVALTSKGRLLRRVTTGPDGRFSAVLVPAHVDEVWLDAGHGRKVRAEVELALR